MPIAPRPIMDETNVNYLEKIVSELDVLIPKAGSLVLVQQGTNFPSHFIIGNRSGLFCLGIELLRAGLRLENNQSSWNPFETETFIDTGYLKADSSEICFSREDSLQKIEYKSNGKRVITGKERFQHIVFGGIFYIFFYGFFALAIIGLITLWRWIF
jgi:hypothetical protein